MIEKVIKSINQILFFSYLALATVTPLIFSTQNTELFEVPKMFFVYFFTATILFLTLIKFILEEKVKIPKSWLLLIFSIFLTIQIFSTITSIDKFTSVFGYPSRLNGGLLSQFAYLAIFACALINLSLDKSKKILAAMVFAAFAVSLWGIPAHFGRDPSCWVLTQKLTAACWKKEFDPTLRIFSTLGQPNWLASYLVLVLPFSLTFFLTLKRGLAKISFFIISATLFVAIILTNSRSGALGTGIALITFAALLGPKYIKKSLLYLGPISLIFLLIALIFGTNLTERLTQAVKPTPPQITGSQNSDAPPIQTAPAPQGTESGQIRLIVWQGAINVFKKWPILGSGPETFVSSYYRFRPQKHNQTTEWEFFYNKAHNEFLNYLANTGILGLIAYTAFILTAIVVLFKLAQREKTEKNIIPKAAIGAIAGYQTTIFFGFSTVATQTIMFTAIAMAQLANANQPLKTFDLNFLKNRLKVPMVIANTALGLFILSLVFRMYAADIFQKRAEDFNFKNPGRELIAYNNAVNTFPSNNPYLMADFSYAIALYLENLQDAKDIHDFTKQADVLAQVSASISPNNYLIIQKIAKTYLLMSKYNSAYPTQAEKFGIRLTKLAPTYPISYSTLAKIQIAMGKEKDAADSLNKALSLKPDFQEAKNLLEQLNAKELQ